MSFVNQSRRTSVADAVCRSPPSWVSYKRRSTSIANVFHQFVLDKTIVSLEQYFVYGKVVSVVLDGNAKSSYFELKCE